MPYAIVKRKASKGSGKPRTCYAVKAARRGRGKKPKYFSKCTTLAKAKRQVRLLHAIDHGFKPGKRNTVITHRRGKTRRSPRY